MSLFDDEILRIVLNFSNPQKQDMVDAGKIGTTMSMAFRNIVKDSLQAGNAIDDVVKKIKQLDSSLRSLQRSGRQDISGLVINQARRMLSMYTPERVESIGEITEIHRKNLPQSSGTASLQAALERISDKIVKRIDEFEKTSAQATLTKDQQTVQNISSTAKELEDALSMRLLEQRRARRNVRYKRDTGILRDDDSGIDRFLIASITGGLTARSRRPLSGADFGVLRSGSGYKEESTPSALGWTAVVIDRQIATLRELQRNIKEMVGPGGSQELLSVFAAQSRFQEKNQQYGGTVVRKKTDVRSGEGLFLAAATGTNTQLQNRRLGEGSAFRNDYWNDLERLRANPIGRSEGQQRMLDAVLRQAAKEQQQKTVYLAGPMRGIPELNFPAFYKAEDLWKKAGWNTINPAQMDKEHGFVPTKTQTVFENLSIEQAMARDLPAVASAHAIALMHGWEKSQGANLELGHAKERGLEVYDAHTFANLGGGVVQSKNHPYELARIASNLGQQHPLYESILDQISDSQAANRASRRASRFLGPASSSSITSSLYASRFSGAGSGEYAPPASRRFSGLAAPYRTSSAAEDDGPLIMFAGRSVYRQLPPAETRPEEVRERVIRQQAAEEEARQRRREEVLRAGQVDTSGLSAREGRFSRFSAWPPPSESRYARGGTFGSQRGSAGGIFGDVAGLFDNLSGGVRRAASGVGSILGSLFGDSSQGQQQTGGSNPRDALRQMRRDDAIARLYKSADAAAQALDEYARSIAPQKAAKVQEDLRNKQQKISDQYEAQIRRNDEQQATARSSGQAQRSRIDLRGQAAEGRFDDRRSRLLLNELFAEDRLGTGAERINARRKEVEATEKFKKLSDTRKEAYVEEKFNAPLRRLNIASVVASYNRQAFDAPTREAHAQAFNEASENLFDLFGGNQMVPGHQEELRQRIASALPSGRGGRMDLGSIMSGLGGAKSASEQSESGRLSSLGSARSSADADRDMRARAVADAADERLRGIGARGQALQDEAQQKRTDAERAEDRVRFRFSLEDEARGSGGGGGGRGSGGGGGGFGGGSRNALDFGIGLASLAGYSSALKSVLLDTVQYAARTEQLNLATQQLARTNYLNTNAVEAYVVAVKRQNTTTQEANTVVQRLIQGQLDVSKAPQLARVAQNVSVISGMDPSSALGNIITGVVTGQTRILHQAGLQVSALAVNRELKGELGHDPSEFQKRQGLLNAVIVEGAKSFGVYEQSLTTAAGQFALLTRNIDETKNAIGTEFIPVYNNFLSVAERGLKIISDNPNAAGAVGAGGVALGAAAGVGGTLAFGRWMAGNLLSAGAAGAGRSTLGGLFGRVAAMGGGAAAEGLAGAGAGEGVLAGIMGLGSGAILPALAMAGAGLGTYALLRQDPDQLRKQTAVEQIKSIMGQMQDLKKLQDKAQEGPGMSSATGGNTQEYYLNAYKTGSESIFGIQQNLTSQLAGEYNKQLDDWHRHMKDLSGDNGFWASFKARILNPGIAGFGGFTGGGGKEPQAGGVPELGITPDYVKKMASRQRQDAVEQLSLDPKVAEKMSQRAADLGAIQQLSEQADKYEQGFEPGGVYDRQLHRRVDNPRAKIADESADFRHKLKDAQDIRKRLAESVASGRVEDRPMLAMLDSTLGKNQDLAIHRDQIDAIEYAKLDAQRNAKHIADLEVVAVSGLHPTVPGYYPSEREALSRRRTTQLEYARRRNTQLQDPDKYAEEKSGIEKEYGTSLEDLRFRQQEEARGLFRTQVTGNAALGAESVLRAPGAGGSIEAIRAASEIERLGILKTTTGTARDVALFEHKLKLQRDITASVGEEAKMSAESFLANRKTAIDLQDTVEHIQGGRAGRSEGEQNVLDISRRQRRAIELARLTYQQGAALPGSNLVELGLQQTQATTSVNAQAAGALVLERQRQVDQRRREVGESYQFASQRVTRLAVLSSANPAEEANAASHEYQTKLEYIDKEFAARDKNIDEEKAKRKQVLEAEYAEVERVLTLRKSRTQEASNFAGGLFENLPFNTPVPGAIPHYLRQFALGQAKTMFQNATSPIIENMFGTASKVFPGQVDKQGNVTELGKILGGSIFGKHMDTKVDTSKMLADITKDNVSAEKDLTAAVRSLDDAIRSAGGLPSGAGDGGTSDSSGSYGTGGRAGATGQTSAGILGAIFPGISGGNVVKKNAGGATVVPSGGGLGGLFASLGNALGSGSGPSLSGGRGGLGGPGDLEVAMVPLAPRSLIDRTGSTPDLGDVGGVGSSSKPLVVVPADVPGSSTSQPYQFTPGGLAKDAQGNFVNYGKYGGVQGTGVQAGVVDMSQTATARTSDVQRFLKSFSGALGGQGGIKGIQAGDKGAALAGDIAGIGATEVGGTLQAVQGFKKGGAKGAISGLAGVATDLSVIPGIGPYAAMAGGALDLISALFPDPKAKREADIQQYMELQRYMAPVTLSRTVSSEGNIVAENRLGGASNTGIAGFPIGVTPNQRIAAYKPYGTIDTQYIDIAGRQNAPVYANGPATGPYGQASYISPSNVSTPAPAAGATLNINLPISSMDSKDVLARSPDIAAAVAKELKIGGGSGDLGYYVNQTVFGAG